MFAEIVIGSAVVVGGVAGVVFLPGAWRRFQQFLVWRSDLKSIAQWAERDRLEAERLELVASIYRRWPETVRVDLQPMDPVGYEERVRIAIAPMPVETVLRVYRARADAVRITLDAKRHKMQVCDAKRVGLAVEVSAGQTAVTGLARRERAGDRAEEVRELPGRHGRRDGRGQEGDVDSSRSRAGRE